MNGSVRPIRDPLLDAPSLVQYLYELRHLLDDHQVTEICINTPGRAYVERYSGWSVEELPFATFDWCYSIGSLAANHTSQGIDEYDPVLSGTLPNGERIQVVLPPVTPEGTVSITVRRPSNFLLTLAEMASAESVFAPLPDGTVIELRPDIFRETQVVSPIANTANDELMALLASGDFLGFMCRAVVLRKNILLSGATGSGKTTVAKSVMLEIPADDRVIVIEDARELILDNQPNHVSLLYSHNGQGAARITGAALLTSALRMRPDRVILAEIRNGDEAYDLLMSVASGHPGSVASTHANSAVGAFVSLAQKMRRCEAGRGMSISEGVEFAKMNIDIVIQCARVKQRRFISEIWYDPSAKRPT